MERTIVYQMTPDDLRIFLREEFEKKDKNALNEFLNQFDDTFIGISEAAAILRVSGQTVRNYINDGRIEPEVRTVENGDHRFRLSYILTRIKQLKESKGKPVSQNL
jgi:DNA invertase Pin-like site-specific DNA recombinase